MGCLGICLRYVCTIFIENLLNKKEDPDPDLDPGLAPGPGPRPGSSEIRVSALSTYSIDCMKWNFSTIIYKVFDYKFY